MQSRYQLPWLICFLGKRSLLYLDGLRIAVVLDAKEDSASKMLPEIGPCCLVEIGPDHRFAMICLLCTCNPHLKLH